MAKENKTYTEALEQEVENLKAKLKTQASEEVIKDSVKALAAEELSLAKLEAEIGDKSYL